jgi:hypothetical protein
MGRRSRAYGLALTVVCCLILGPTGAASAETGGHFTSEAAHTTLSGSETSTHKTKVTGDGLEGFINCNQVSYSGTVNATTVSELQLTPSYSGCGTEGTSTAVTFTPNGCSYILTIGKSASGDNTLDVACPTGKALEIHHPNCGITVPAQTGLSGVAYTEVVENGKRALTVDVTLVLADQYHQGICIFLGTSHNMQLNGSFTLKGTNTASEQVNVRATGSEEVEFQTETAHTGLTGSSNSSTMTFGVLLGSVECTSTSLDGTSAATAFSELTVRPAYSGCKGTGREVTTHMNSCAYILKTTGAHGAVAIECPAGKSIETTIDKFPEGCTITIPAQTAGGVVDYKEEGAGTGRDLKLTWTLEGLHYTRDGCEVGGEGNNGTMSGSITLSGEDTSGNPKGLWIE